eukprot:5413138-Prymnesium_polylepis.1
MKDFGFLTLAALSDGDRRQAITERLSEWPFPRTTWSFAGRSDFLRNLRRTTHIKVSARPFAARPRTC